MRVYTINRTQVSNIEFFESLSRDIPDAKQYREIADKLRFGEIIPVRIQNGGYHIYSSQKKRAFRKA